jgi:predicted 3-demethylubiquinone-9 3-methyltransferase (glyoxalase superfamily)/polyhydroxyalkanoate synthesis regulator phasin
VKEAQIVSILSTPRIDSSAQSALSSDHKLVMTYLLSGEEAGSLSKDLSQEIKTWQIHSIEQLHQRILDLLSFLRRKKIELELALSFLDGEQITFATYRGKIALQRANQVRVILQSDQEIKMLSGHYKDGDLILLSNQAAEEFLTISLEKLQNQTSLEALISQLSILKQDKTNDQISLSFLSYIQVAKQNIVETIAQKEAWPQKLSNFYQKSLPKIKFISKKIVEITKKIASSIKKQDKKKVMLVLAAIFFAGALLLIVLAWNNSQQNKELQSVENQLKEFQKQSQDIENLIDRQPLAARENMAQLIAQMEALRDETANKKGRDLLDLEIQKLKELNNNLSTTNALDQLSIIHDLGDFLAKKIIVADQSIFLLENNGKEILQITDQQQKKNFSLENQLAIRDFTISDNQLFALGNGIWLLDLASADSSWQQIKEEGESDKTAEYLNSFGPYLYLFNREKRNVYRYAYQSDKLSDPIGWLVDKKGINFDLVSDVLVDGDLWMGQKNGQLYKFSKGSQAAFTLAGLQKPLENQLSIASNGEDGKIAILEKQAKRLLILTSDGQLISEIQSNELSGVNSIAFTTDGDNLYALSGSIIYQIKTSL